MKPSRTSLVVLSFLYAWNTRGCTGLSNRQQRERSHRFFSDASRSQVLNLLHHPLQLQLATGELPLGAYQRLIHDREAILEGIHAATKNNDLCQEEL